jgi:cytochrome c oxidase subunit 2
MCDAYLGLFHRVLIASVNPLFARGLEKLITRHREGREVDIRLVGSMAEVIVALENWEPDLVILDFDDVDKPGAIQREAFLSRFFAGEQPMQVMLVSLSASGKAVVYDRRTLTPAQAEDWLDLPLMNPTSNRCRGGVKHYDIAGVLTLIFTVFSGVILLANIMRNGLRGKYARNATGASKRRPIAGTSSISCGSSSTRCCG